MTDSELQLENNNKSTGVKSLINFGWIDFSAADMRRVKDALAAMNSGSIDELGIAIIRDGFADRLFPGFNVAQTSLKYFLLIPAMLKDIELSFRSEIIKESSKDNNESNLFRLIRQKLIALECKFCDEACTVAKADTTNIIGNDTANSDIKPEKRLVRFPHDIYWHGLYTFGLVGEPDMRTYIRNLKARFSQEKYTRGHILNYWKKFFPYDNPDDFLVVQEQKTPLQLTNKEEEFLRGKIKEAIRGKNTLLEKVMDANISLPSENKAAAIAEVLNNYGLDDAGKAAQFALYMRCAFLGFNIAYFRGDSEKVDNFLREINDLKNNIGTFDLKFLESIADEFHYRQKKATVLKAMKNYFELLDEDFTADKIQEKMIQWEKAAKGPKAYLEKSTPTDKETWRGMKYLDFRLETALKLFGDQRRNSQGSVNEQ